MNDDALIEDALVASVTDSDFAFTALNLMQRLITRKVLPTSKAALALRAQQRLQQHGSTSDPQAARSARSAAADQEEPPQRRLQQPFAWPNVASRSASATTGKPLVRSCPARTGQTVPVPHSSRHTTRALGQWGYWRNTAAASW